VAVRAAGLILGCRALPWSDAEVSWLDSEEIVLFPQRRLRCRVVALDDLTHDIRRVRLAIEAGGPFAFAAGQYARLTFGGLPPRDYSMANRPEENTLEFHIRRMGEGNVSAHVAAELRLGDRVTAEGPLGTAYLRSQHTGPILAIAGGSGLAPIKAIVETALAAERGQPIRLYFGARNERDLYLVEHFNALAAAHANFRFVPVLSEPQLPTTQRTGLVHQVVAADFAALKGAKAYLAGPPVMVEAASALLVERLGFRPEDVHADPFYSEAEKAAQQAAAL
jgi:naphthalene 1,2-dioxygenase ferredoxin reductase component